MLPTVLKSFIVLWEAWTKHCFIIHLLRTCGCLHLRRFRNSTACQASLVKTWLVSCWAWPTARVLRWGQCIGCLGSAHQLRRLHTADRHFLKTLCHPRSRETRIEQEHPWKLSVRESELLMSSADSRQLTSLLSVNCCPFAHWWSLSNVCCGTSEILSQDWHWPESRLRISSNMILLRQEKPTRVVR